MKRSREQFEEWFNEIMKPAMEKIDIDWPERQLVNDVSWSAWKSSRAAIEIELKQFDHFQICHYGADEKYADGYIDAQNNANKAIDFAGLKVKS